MALEASSLRARERATVIALHATGSHGGQWNALRELLTPDVQVLAPDLHGHGNGPEVHGVDASVVANDVTRIHELCQRTAGAIHLVGHSYGGAVALRVALLRPRAVRSLAVYEPVEFPILLEYNRKTRDATQILEVAATLRRRMLAGDAASAAAFFVDYWSGTGAWQVLSERQRGGLVPRMNVVVSQFASLLHSGPALAQYRGLRVPSLILSGQSTRAPVRRIAEILRFAIPGAVGLALPDAGHMEPITRPDRIARRIAAFVRGNLPLPLPVAVQKAA